MSKASTHPWPHLLFLLSPTTLRLLGLVCCANSVSHCQHADYDNGLCPQLSLEEGIGTPGTVLWQYKRHALLKKHLSETSIDHADGATVEHATEQAAGSRWGSKGYAALERRVANFWMERSAAFKPPKQTILQTNASSINRPGVAKSAEGEALHRSAHFGATALHALERRDPSENSTGLLRSFEALENRSGETLERRVPNIHDGVAVIVPGLGSEERAVTVEKNIQWLKRQNVPFDCWIFIYKTEEELPLNKSRFDPCNMIRRPGFWLGHMHAMPLNKTNRQWVLHMEESSEAQPDMNLTLMLEIMVTNGLGHAAPTFDTQKTANPYGCEPPCGCCGSLYPVLARQPNISTGRFVDFIELHIDLFTREHFACLQDNIDTSDENTLHGWGMDRLLPALCGGAYGGADVEAGRMGVFDQMTVEKRHHGSYNPEAAFKGMVVFVGEHPTTSAPTFASLGELDSPCPSGNRNCVGKKGA